MKRRHALSIVSVAAALTLGFAFQYWNSENAIPRIPMASVSEDAASTIHASTANSQPGQAAAQSSSHSVVGSAASLSKLFDSYIKAGSPESQFMAYKLARTCVMNAEMLRSYELIPIGERTPEVQAMIAGGALRKAQSDTCGDLSQKQLAARTEYAKVAAEAGIPGAAVYLSSEPPFGDASAYANRPDDPAVLDYRRYIVDLIKLAASKGDSWSMVVLSDMYATGQGEVEKREPIKALEYHVAARDVMEKEAAGMLPYVDKKTAQLEAGLSAEQIEAAKEAGHALAIGAKK